MEDLLVNPNYNSWKELRQSKAREWKLASITLLILSFFISLCSSFKCPASTLYSNTITIDRVTKIN